MYIPSAFKIDAPHQLRAFAVQNPFATLVTQRDGLPIASHLPVLVANPEGAPARIQAHLARANPQWHDFSTQEVLLIFQGPHAYISPFWYESSPAVPTWNYAVLHLYGRAKVITEENQSRLVIETLTRQFEPDRADELFRRWSQQYFDRMLQGIVAFEIEVTRLEGKFKLGQNRSASDISGTYEALHDSTDLHNRELAAFMQQHGLIP